MAQREQRASETQAKAAAIISSRQAEAFARLEACQDVLVERMIDTLNRGRFTCR